MQREIRVGTRASALATKQTRIFCQLLSEAFPDLTLTEVRITTEGDTTTAPLVNSRTPGVFVGALRTALLNHQVDFIVHSMKDLPVQPHPRIITACVPAREDCRDVLISVGGGGSRSSSYRSTHVWAPRLLDAQLNYVGIEATLNY